MWFKFCNAYRLQDHCISYSHIFAFRLPALLLDKSIIICQISCWYAVLRTGKSIIVIINGFSGKDETSTFTFLWSSNEYCIYRESKNSSNIVIINGFSGKDETSTFTFLWSSNEHCIYRESKNSSKKVLSFLVAKRYTDLETAKYLPPFSWIA